MRVATKALALAAAGIVAAWPALAVEYPLHFAPVGDYQDLVVAGYQIAGQTIVGNCSYTAIVSGSGRDPRQTYVPVPQTCSWDVFGNLLAVASGAPAIPTPLFTRGTQTIYARKSAHLYTGADSALSPAGFVFTYGAHYTWLTPATVLVLPQQPYAFTVTLVSNGDVALKVRRVTAGTALAGTVDNPATRLVVTSTSCTGLIPAGATCVVALTYTDTGLTAPSGLAYDTLTIHLLTNAGVTADFVQRVTDIVSLPTDN